MHTLVLFVTETICPCCGADNEVGRGRAHDQRRGTGTLRQGTQTPPVLSRPALLHLTARKHTQQSI
jgi:hypothetical protein